MVELRIFRLGPGLCTFDRRNKPAVFVGLDIDGLVRPGLKRHLHRERHFAAIEVELPVERQFESRAFLHHPGRKHRLDGGSQCLGGFLADATLRQGVDQRFALGQFEGFIGRFGRHLFGDGGDVLAVIADHLDFGIDDGRLAVAIWQVIRCDFGIGVGIVEIALGNDQLSRRLGLGGIG